MEMGDRSESEEVKLEEEPKTTQEEEEEEEEEVVEGGQENIDSKSTCQTLLPNNRCETMPTSASNTISPVAGPQLTIFYGGSVKVFDGIPEEKVNEIIRIAAAAAAAAAAADAAAAIKSSDVKNIDTDNASGSSSPVPARSPALQNTAAAMGSLLAQLCPAHKSSLCKLQAEFPIARRHSLQRFLEKRRDRLVSKSPYPSSPAMKVENDTII